MMIPSLYLPSPRARTLRDNPNHLEKTPSPQVFPTHNLKRLLQMLSGIPKHHVLDLGRLSGPNIEWLIQRGFKVYVDDRVKEYILSIVFATRKPSEFGLDIGPLIEFGASPRATLFLAQAARAHAFIRSRGYVTPEDVKSVGPDVLRHRLILSFEAEAENVKPEEIVQRIFDTVEVP